MSESESDTLIKEQETEDFEIYIKTLFGRTTILSVNSLNSIAEVKEKIFEKDEVPIDKQILIYCGKPLENGSSLEKYEIKKHATLHLMIKIFEVNKSDNDLNQTNFT